MSSDRSALPEYRARANPGRNGSGYTHTEDARRRQPRAEDAESVTARTRSHSQPPEAPVHLREVTAQPPEVPVHVQVQQILQGVAQQGRYGLLSVVRSRNMDGFIRVHDVPGWVQGNMQQLLQSRAFIVVFDFENPAERQDLRQVVRALLRASPRLAKIPVFAVPMLIDSAILTRQPEAIEEVIETGVAQFLTQVDAGLSATIEVALLKADIRDRELREFRQEVEHYRSELQYTVWQWVPSQMRLALPNVDPNLEVFPDGSVDGLQFIRSIGQGTFGMVHEARTPQGETFAVKVLEKENAPSMRKVEHIYREVQVLSTLPQHPHLACLKKVIHAPDTIYICLTYGGPMNLSRTQFQQPNRAFALTTAQELFGQVADAVGHMHRRITFHRDIRPENIAVSGTEERGYHAMLVDFGLTVNTEAPLRRFVGSLPFASPEMLNVPCRYFGGPADAFALGMLLFEMVRGQSTMEDQLGWNRLTEPSPRRARELRHLLGNGPPDVNRDRNEPHEVAVLLSGLLQVDPAERMNLVQVLQSPWLSNAAAQ